MAYFNSRNQRLDGKRMNEDKKLEQFYKELKETVIAPEVIETVNTYLKNQDVKRIPRRYPNVCN